MSLAIYPGSFDPITKGHIDVLKKAVKIFDKVIIAVSINPAKTGMFSLEERVEMIKQSIGDLEKVEVDSFTGLTAEYARKKGCKSNHPRVESCQRFWVRNANGSNEQQYLWRDRNCFFGS